MHKFQLRSKNNTFLNELSRKVYGIIFDESGHLRLKMNNDNFPLLHSESKKSTVNEAKKGFYTHFLVIYRFSTKISTKKWGWWFSKKKFL